MKHQEEEEEEEEEEEKQKLTSTYQKQTHNQPTPKQHAKQTCRTTNIYIFHIPTNAFIFINIHLPRKHLHISHSYSINIHKIKSRIPNLAPLTI